MIVELHMVQNFAPGNLNRDDTGAPKDCEFGGTRRARISSQCLKRSMRELVRERGLVGETNLGMRTRRLVGLVAGELQRRGKDAAEAEAVADAVLAALDLQSANAGTSDFLVFISPKEIGLVADVCEANWSELAEVANSAATPAKGKKRAYKLPATIKSEMTKALDASSAVDISLFGRMIATAPELNVEAASQVAHAISTNRVSMEFDFYAAVDDLQSDEESGAGMLGTVEFNSSCYYRYSNLDVGQLQHNLAGDPELTRMAIAAFVEGSILAVPSGKQNTFAAHNPPSLVLAEVRDGQPISMANAFVSPVVSGRGQDLVRESIERLARYRERVGAVYGMPAAAGVITTEEELPPSLKRQQLATVSDLVGLVLREVVGEAADLG